MITYITGTNTQTADAFLVTVLLALLMSLLTPVGYSPGVQGDFTRTSVANYDIPQFPCVDCPRYRFGDTVFAPLSWDLFIHNGAVNRLYYQISSSAPSCTVSFEWYTSGFLSKTEYYHLVASFYEEERGADTFKYYQVSDKGARAEVGTEGYTNQQYAVYSSRQPIITPGLELTYDPATKAFTAGTIRDRVMLL